MKRKPLLPLMPVVLLLGWLLLNDSLSAGDVVLGLAFGVLVTLAVARLRPLPALPRRLPVAIGLTGRVLVDVVRSNLAVGSVILGATKRHPQVGFMKIPLDMRDPHGLAMLALIVTATPGTVWAGHDPDSNVLTLHVLDLIDEAAWMHTIKDRYERPLMEIFE
jgi:multicomponent K+:H+ antiporter subunit E